MDGMDLKSIRGTLGESAEQFAARLGVTPQYLSQVERGTRPFTRKLHTAVLRRVLDTVEWEDAMHRLADLPEETRRICA